MAVHDQCYSVRRAPAHAGDDSTVVSSHWEYRCVIYTRTARTDGRFIWKATTTMPSHMSQEAAYADGDTTGLYYNADAYNGGCATRLEDVMDPATVALWRLGTLQLKLFRTTGKSRYYHYAIGTKQPRSHKPYAMLCRVGAWTVKQDLGKHLKLDVLTVPKLPRKVGKPCNPKI